MKMNTLDADSDRIVPGCIVRAINSSGGGFSKGSYYLVTNVRSSVEIALDDKGSTSNGWGAHNFVRVKTKPVEKAKAGDIVMRTHSGGEYPAGRSHVLTKVTGSGDLHYKKNGWFTEDTYHRIAIIDDNQDAPEEPKKSKQKTKDIDMGKIGNITTTVVDELKALANQSGAAEIAQGRLLYNNFEATFGRTVVKIPVLHRAVGIVSKKMRLKNEVTKIGATLAALVLLKQFYDHKLLGYVRGYLVHRLYEIVIEATGADDIVTLVQTTLKAEELGGKE